MTNRVEVPDNGEFLYTDVSRNGGLAEAEVYRRRGERGKGTIIAQSRYIFQAEVAGNAAAAQLTIQE